MTSPKDKKKSDEPTTDKEAWEKLRKGLEDILEKGVEGYDRWDRDKNPEDFGKKNDEKPSGPTP